MQSVPASSVLAGPDQTNTIECPGSVKDAKEEKLSKSEEKSGQHLDILL
jgi:hypothetical protein